MSVKPPIAPGAIVEVRTEAWRVQRTERASDGSTLLYVRGVSELVRNREAIFVKEHEERLQKVQVLAPETTELKADSSPKFRDALLHMESLLRAIPPTDDRLYIGHKAAMDALDYQLEPARRLSRTTNTACTWRTPSRNAPSSPSSSHSAQIRS